MGWDAMITGGWVLVGREGRCWLLAPLPALLPASLLLVLCPRRQRRSPRPLRGRPRSPRAASPAPPLSPSPRLAETQLLEAGGPPGGRGQVVRWLRTFPFSFISQREYVIARRVFRAGELAEKEAV